MRWNQHTIGIMVIFLWLQFACQSQSNETMDYYEWTPTNTAPKNYPIYVHHGYFKADDGSIIATPDHRAIHHGWEQTGAVFITGEPQKPLPSSLHVSWYSFAEDLYYQTEVALPVTRLRSLFQEGFSNPKTGGQETYTTLSYGLAPGGLVAVWLIGVGHRVEVASTIASPTSFEFSKMVPTTDLSREAFRTLVLQEYSSEQVLSEIAAGTIPLDRWTTYRTKQNWLLEVKHAAGCTPGYATVSLRNGEQEVLYFDRNLQTPAEERALPSRMRLTWKDEENRAFAATVNFDPETIAKKMKSFEDSTEEPIRYLFKIGAFNEIIEVHVQQADKTLTLEDIDIKIYAK